MLIGHVSTLTPDATRAGQPQATPSGFSGELERAHRQPIAVAPRRTTLSSAEASATLAQAWKDRFGEAPAPNTLALLTAQWSHETAEGQSMFNYNFAGIKGVGPSGLQVTQRTREGYGAQERVIRDGFRAYDTALDGAADYLSLLDRKYPDAVQAAQQGDVSGFVDELHRGGYFTGDKRAYERNVSRRADAFMASAAGGPDEGVRDAARPLPSFSSVNVPLTERSGLAQLPPAQRVASLRPTAISTALAEPTLPREPSLIDLERFTDHLAIAALRIASAPEPEKA